jgi:hypothetical protein
MRHSRSQFGLVQELMLEQVQISMIEPQSEGFFPEERQNEMLQCHLSGRGT